MATTSNRHALSYCRFAARCNTATAAPSKWNRCTPSATASREDVGPVSTRARSTAPTGVPHAPRRASMSPNVW